VRTLAFLTGIALPGTAWAAEAFDACMNGARSTPEYSECSRAEIARQDRLLNDIWRRVSADMKAPDTNSFNALLNEQRKWIQWKKSACQYYQDSFGSEGKSIRFPQCLVNILRDRVTYLTALASEL
jgi:uncharacterized protein YecT (DUF1311 family)